MEQEQKTAVLSWQSEDQVHSHTIRTDELTVGRKGDCDLILNHSSISREHATISYSPEGYQLKDLDSSYGTRLCGKALKPFESYPLKTGDVIMVGKLKIDFNLGGQAPPQMNEEPLLHLNVPSSLMLHEMNSFSTSLWSLIDQTLGSGDAASKLKTLLRGEVAQLNHFVEQRFQEYEVLQEITQIIVGILDLRELLSTVLKLASRVLRADRGFILLYDSTHNDLRSMVTRHFDREDHSAHEHDLVFSQTIARSCFESKEMVIIDDAMQDERFESAHSIVASSIRSVVCLPLIKGEQVSGVLYLDNLSTPGCFSKHQLSFLKSFAAQTALALDNARLYTQAVTDGLTTLHNRKFVDERIAEEMLRARRYDRKCSLILLDVDFFKKVNDNFGHHAGDMVLKRIAHTLQTQARSSDVVARYGGEEFMMLLTETDLEGAIIFAERLRIAISEMEINVDNKTIKITISCGVVTYRRDFRTSVKSFVSEADQGMYQAKQMGRDQVCVINEEL